MLLYILACCMQQAHIRIGQFTVSPDTRMADISAIRIYICVNLGNVHVDV